MEVGECEPFLHPVWGVYKVRPICMTNVTVDWRALNLTSVYVLIMMLVTVIKRKNISLLTSLWMCGLHFPCESGSHPHQFLTLFISFKSFQHICLKNSKLSPITFRVYYAFRLPRVTNVPNFMWGTRNDYSDRLRWMYSPLVIYYQILL